MTNEEYYEKKRLEKLDKIKQYKLTHKEEIKKRNKNWYDRKGAKYHREYKQNNEEARLKAIAGTKKWFKEHPNYLKERFEKNPLERIKANVRKKLNYAILKGVVKRKACKNVGN